ncbi:ATP-binding protein [Streptomyces sp. NPDC059740]|uniref:ATP-binding protein n=1 Tax=Streptomyces sp. NPDC059740 TaxID=3346926 RepID=UPI00364DBB6E
MSVNTEETGRSFSVRLSSTRRGARLARQLVLSQLCLWGVPVSGEFGADVASVVGELAANAVFHGRSPGRDFELAVSCSPPLLRVAVTDTRPERLPPSSGHSPRPAPEEEGGRGLRLVDALALERGMVVGPVTKTVWAALRLPGC